MSKEFILDLGIGSGGVYIDHDPADRLRIGADLRIKKLARITESYHIQGIQLDISEGTLPFAHSSMDGMDIIMPHNDLLINLTDPTCGLWQEIYRVLKPETAVNIIFDVQVKPSAVNYREIKMPSGIKILIQPHQSIISAAKAAGFETTSNNVTRNELLQINTKYCNSRAKRMEEKGDTLAFRVTATKKAKTE